MRPESMPARLLVGQCPARSSARGSRSVRVAVVSREAVGFVVLGFSVLAWFTEETPRPQGVPPLLVRGEPGVQIWSFALSPDGKTMAMRDDTGRLALRDAESGWSIERTLPFSGYPRALAFSADGRFLACGGVSAGITLYDLESDAAARTLAVPVDHVKSIAFAPDGRTLAVAVDGNTEIFLWDLTAGRVRRSLHAPSLVQCVAFAPDGRHLASGGRDGTPSIMLWDLDSGLGRALCKETLGPINLVAFSPDGKLLAATFAWERGVRIYDLGSTERPRVIEGHRFGTNSVVFSPDGLTLATAGNDGTARLWTVANGREQAILDGGAQSMGPAAFADGGTCLVATSRNDDDVRVWNLAELGPRAILDHRPELGPPAQLAGEPGGFTGPVPVKPHSGIEPKGVYPWGSMQEALGSLRSQPAVGTDDQDRTAPPVRGFSGNNPRSDCLLPAKMP